MPSPLHPTAATIQGRFRIRAGVRPYAGRILLVDRREDLSLGGWVQLGARVATARRWYALSELMPVSDEATLLAARMGDEREAESRPDPDHPAGEEQPRQPQ